MAATKNKPFSCINWKANNKVAARCNKGQFFAILFGINLKQSAYCKILDLIDILFWHKHTSLQSRLPWVTGHCFSYRLQEFQSFLKRVERERQHFAPLTIPPRSQPVPNNDQFSERHSTSPVRFSFRVTLSHFIRNIDSYNGLIFIFL